MASHQFKTPLAVIQANAELYELLSSTGNEIEPSKFAKISGRIKDAIATMSELLDEILVLGKVTSGQYSLPSRKYGFGGYWSKIG